MVPLLRLRGDLSRFRKSDEELKVSDASYDLRAAWETSKGWLEDPSSLQKIDLNILSRLLFVVYGLDPEEVMRPGFDFNNIFGLVDKDNSP